MGTGSDSPSAGALVPSDSQTGPGGVAPHCLIPWASSPRRSHPQPLCLILAQLGHQASGFCGRHHTSNPPEDLQESPSGLRGQGAGSSPESWPRMPPQHWPVLPLGPSDSRYAPPHMFSRGAILKESLKDMTHSVRCSAGGQFSAWGQTWLTTTMGMVQPRDHMGYFSTLCLGFL